MKFSRQFVLFTGLALGASACRLNDDGAPVSVVPSLSTATLQAGDTVRVSTLVTNTGTTEIRINGGNCNLHFEVLGANGEIVGPAEAIVCLTSFESATLAPGASLTFEGFYTGRTYEPLRSPGATQEFYVPAGRYTIRGRVVGESLRRIVVGKSVELTVSSPP